MTSHPPGIFVRRKKSLALGAIFKFRNVRADSRGVGSCGSGDAATIRVTWLLTTQEIITSSATAICDFDILAFLIERMRIRI